MALLAEQKRKSRFGLDPRNTSWSNDTSKFGQRLMEKMGWEKGKGLGANENGITEHIRATYKSDSRGLGCTPQDADAWIAHQDDFNDLLKALNSQSEAGSQEEKVERTEHVDGRKRYHGRFARGQVQTLRSTEDLDCIFGKRKGKSKTAEPDEQPAPEPDCGDGKEEKSHGLTTVTSTSSVQEYFAKKMAEMKARKEVNAREDDSSETSPRGKDGVNCEKKKKQKSSMFGSVSFSYDEVKEVSGSAGVERAAGKPCRGWYKDFLENQSGNVENIEVKDKSSKKKKTKSDIEDNDFEEKVKMSHSKKQKKKNRDKVLDDSLAVVNSCSVLESHKLPSVAEVAENKQSKKKKKNKDSEAVSVYTGVSTENINVEKEDVKKQKEKRKASTKDEGKDKKQSKKKNKENEAVPAASVCEGVNTVNISEEHEDKKKQKKNRKASNKDEIEVISLNKCALDSDEVDVNETAIDAISLKHSSKRLVTHNNDDNKQEKEISGSTGHKKKNKKRKQSEIIDEESKPVENKCDNNDEVAVESKKKKKKRKHSEINDEVSKPVESECDKNDDATVEPKKKKKRRKGNDNDAQDTEDPAAAEHKSNISSGNQNIIDVSQSSEQKQKKKRKRKKKSKPLQDQSVKSNAFFPGSNLADIVGYGHKSRETKKCSKEDSKSSKQKV
ncbi:unnamed protein product [Candidula unifasciata]|uniref:G-patch domain-containing protein n=1 Tax=Candidula unifasciata TaxID=100452 RepID=A0A8S3ZYL3_9EUPU|nr:unnamed protein product [Candidula unifasciata]